MKILCCSRLEIRILACALFWLGGSPVFAEEGMWTFDNPPTRQLEESYGFTPTPEWLEHVRLSSVRFNDGGSGSFVSPHGLVLTNHHVASGQLQKLSSAETDYLKTGFYATSRDEELQCPDLELNVLLSMHNVTDRVQGAVQEGMTDAQALAARRAEIAAIQKDSLDETGLRSDVISLYGGGEYWLYRYQKYTDVRLVFAPEQQIAFFGGDQDNFTYPRHDLDFAFLRVYENGRPLESGHYLRWNSRGADPGELVFVSGNPGSTNRLRTLAQVELQRDYFLPYALKTLQRQLEALEEYSALGQEQARQATGNIFGIQNTLKAFTGAYNGLLGKALIEKKQKEESEFRSLVASRREWRKEFGGAWQEIADAQQAYAEQFKLERFRRLRSSQMAALALTLVQYVAEIAKPDADRLDGFHASELESLQFQLFSPAPLYPEMEEVLLSETLQESLEELGADDPFVRDVLHGRTPAEVANEALGKTRIGDPAFRKSLAEGGEQAVAETDDPLVVLARRADPWVRKMRSWREDTVQSVEISAGERIGKARFAVYGKSVYPDATFTLRLAYGSVKGYPMNGTVAPPKTTLHGLFDRAIGFNLQPPYQLPEKYIERRDTLALDTGLNFVSTCDITGGNSGSPVINRDAELVGLVFDGNIESLVGDYVYYPGNNRAVSVHSAAIIEVLRKIYDAGALVEELVRD